MTTDCDYQWRIIMMACIGQLLEGEEDDSICGATVSIRKGFNRLSLWTKNADDEDANLRIGASLREVLELDASFTIYYKGHWDKSTPTQEGRYSL